ncbi:MAG TPA: hypothetical protein ENH09_00415 [Bacteroidetes bacterium]|nr:hypothetical protein [Bacteroidota bacterium]
MARIGTQKELRQGDVSALGHVLPDIEVKAAHVVTECRGTGVPIGFDGGLFGLLEGNGIGKFTRSKDRQQRVFDFGYGELRDFGGWVWRLREKMKEENNSDDLSEKGFFHRDYK